MDIESNASEFFGISGARTRKRAKELNYSNFDAIKISIASPEKILSWSYGEVKKPETINYRTLKPERDGLLCERIFGPQKDNECSCGKYRWAKFKGVVCDRCGVEVTDSRVRRERMGHIELACPIAHVWFLRKNPSRIGIILNMRPTDLEKVVYYAAHVVLEDTRDPVTGRIEYTRCRVLNEKELSEARKKFPRIKVGIGAAAIRTLLESIDLKAEMAKIEKEISTIKNDADRTKAVKRMKILEGFLHSNNRPEWMVLTVLPVLPPDLRPLVHLDGGRFASSDLNDLYRRIINRNNRLKHIEALRAPQVMIYNEKRLLQEAVDALIENGARGKVVLGPGGSRALKSISDTLKGKQGRFRQNLLGKRVDYSGRSVIVVGPNLKLNQCGLPKTMARELFKPFILAELIKKESTTMKTAKKRMEDLNDPEIWDILEQVTKKHPVMLNRAPTLHRLGIQAFEPILIEGLAIQLHPLTCAAFNADFDGDQMAVHVPISQEAQMEARMLMMATNNILSPASGRPVATPSNDMVLGINYITRFKPGEKGEGLIFCDREDAISAHQYGKVDLHARIKVRGMNDISSASEDFDKEKGTWKPVSEWKDCVSIGRLIFFGTLPPKINWRNYNKPMSKKDLSGLVYESFTNPEVGHHETVVLLDKIMNLGFHYCTLSGLSISIADMLIPESKPKLIAQAQKEVALIKEQMEEGVMSEKERSSKISSIWTSTGDRLASDMIKVLKQQENKPYVEGEQRFNSVYMMLDSGARGNLNQVKQLLCMRGQMQKPQKKLDESGSSVIENPILANFREGQTVLEYFISTHGGRKGLSDTALKTSEAGYLTRRLIDAGHNTVISEYDCGTENGVEMKALYSDDKMLEPLSDRIVGRTALEDIELKDEKGNDISIKKGEIILARQAEAVEKAKISSVLVRSILTCELDHGICAKCYGQNLATGYLVEPGEAVGIIAAQSIGEPGTQLTLRTFHSGGSAQNVLAKTELRAKTEGKVSFKNVRTIRDSAGTDICVSRNAVVTVTYPDPKKFPADEQEIMYGSSIIVKDGAKVAKGDLIAQWDPQTNKVITEHTGTAEFVDIKEGVTLLRKRDKATGIVESTIIQQRGAKRSPRIIIRGAGNEILETLTLAVDTVLRIDDGAEVHCGDIIATQSRDTSKTKDITSGLPRIAELFEVRKPKNAAIISRIDGIVSMGTTPKGLQEVTVKNEETMQTESYPIPFGKRIVVYEGDRVTAGESLTDGSVDMQDLLSVKGVREVQNHIVNAIQEVYRSQDVKIHDKYIEIIVRQMLSNVRIIDPGETKLLKGEIVHRGTFRKENDAAREMGKTPAQAEPVLLGISKASLASESFISAASFQETTRVLTDAATTSKTDYLTGLKENVIIGHLVPAGSGYATRTLAEAVKKRNSSSGESKQE